MFQMKVLGQSSIELVLLLFLILVFGLLCLDVSAVLAGAYTNEVAGRNAARAAAQGDTPETSLALAQAAVKSYGARGWLETPVTIDTGNFLYQDFGGNVPNGASPFVRVSNRVTVKVPAPHLLLGGEICANGTITFVATHVYPIVKTKMYVRPE
jgi:hypothetical protein